MKKLIAYLNSIHPLPDACIKRLVSVIHIKHLKEDEFLLQPGEVCNHAYFLVSGTLAGFPRYVSDFFRADWATARPRIILCAAGYFTQLPSQEHIIACKDSKLLFISKATLDPLYIEFPELEVLTSKLLSRYHRLDKLTFPGISGMNKRKVFSCN